MNEKKLTLGVDIGGSHITASLVEDNACMQQSVVRRAINSSADAPSILDNWASVINEVLQYAGNSYVASIGIAMPGPFDYASGSSMIKGMNKYEGLFGMNIKECLRSRISHPDMAIYFANDAACFGIGEAAKNVKKEAEKLIAITLGTGLGACYVINGQAVTSGKGVPRSGYLYNFPFLASIAEDYISARWLVQQFNASSGKHVTDVKQLAEIAEVAQEINQDSDVLLARNVFTQFGSSLGQFILPRLQAFAADKLVIGGSVAKARKLFLPAMLKEMQKQTVEFEILFAEDTEKSSIIGASLWACREQEQRTKKKERKSKQAQLPYHVDTTTEIKDGYRLFPFEPLGQGKIQSGYVSLAKWIITQKKVRIDGYEGLNWDHVRTQLFTAIRSLGADGVWYDAKAFEKPEEEISAIVEPFTGVSNSVWGKRTTLQLADFFDPSFFSWQPEEMSGLTIVAGTGAGLCSWEAPLVYIDLPKNELQYRMRASTAFNIGSSQARAFAEMYKRSYFVDWVVLAAHRQQIYSSIDIVADGQWKETINWCYRTDIEEGLKQISKNVIRARPWFEPGVWGGQWLKKHVPEVSQQEINYAWSFELIAPENGLVFESDGALMEISFDWLMETKSEDVLGVDAARFGNEFPIRFDFLDTYDGGNLSIQCHPSLPYIQQHFGENITQDETYYILDCEEDASVYLGFTDNADADNFREALEQSHRHGQPVDIDKYVQKLPANKHDLFLIPNQTVHGAGTGNLVLEISATPYIYTFKMYDWMRPDLNGKPRPINIEHAFKNLDFTRKGKKVPEELISYPVIINQQEGYTVEMLPTHPQHFYSIQRITLPSITGKIEISTESKCHLLMLVEGNHLLLKTKNGKQVEIRYAETYVIPAAAEAYELINMANKNARVIKAFVS